MIRRNIDVVAIVVLLTVMAIFSEVRQAMLLQVVPNRGIVLASDIVHRAFQCPSKASIPALTPLVFSR